MENRTVKATSKWRNALDELPVREGAYLTAWATGSGKWVSEVQWFSTEDKQFERMQPDLWARINLPRGGVR